MQKKTKKFDCVETKHEVQDKLIREYETRKGEFTSYLDFVRAKSEESEWVRKQRTRMHAV